MAYDISVSDERDMLFGDPRRCPRHPNVATSSPDGMIDGLCGECEAAMDAAYYEEEFQQQAQLAFEARIAEATDAEIDGRLSQTSSHAGAHLGG